MKIGKDIPKTPQPKSAPIDVAQIKYPKPKVLLLDVPAPAADAVIARGFNVSVGTLGTPYRVGKGDGFQPMIGSADLPNYTEQEIVVVELHIESFADGPDGEKHRPDGELDFWAKCDRGFIDPRPRAAFTVYESFNRTKASGGAFIVFADARTGIELMTARKQGWRGGDLYDRTLFPLDAWNFIDELNDIEVRDDHGREMRTADNSALGKLLAEHLDGGQFLCTVEGGYRGEDPWVTLAVNKFGQPVGICRCRGKKGTVIVLPQIAEKGRFLANLFTNVLPELAPHLFPHVEQGAWAHRDEYELEVVLEIRAGQAAIEQRARDEIAELETRLANERTTNGWLHEMLTGTGTPLVEAIRKAFAAIGFTEVVDVDEERDREGKSRREDLQIRDESPMLVVDIKGLGGFASDEDVLQADKHSAIRMREQGRTDITGLSIINHQRHLPPLDRENGMPFRQELLDAAEERMLGLMTSWDLYRLVRNFRRLDWRPEDVKPLFYRKGRISPIPLHYKFIGTIKKAWSEKFGVVISEGELRVGDRLAVEFSVDFEEVEVPSIQVENKNADRAVVGDPAGLLWPAGKPKLREGLRVFRVPPAK